MNKKNSLNSHYFKCIFLFFIFPFSISSFANDDGSSRQEVGNPASDAMLVSGSYSFITPEGELVEMQYTADEFGYHASGSHMPTTPPPPPHVR